MVESSYGAGFWPSLYEPFRKVGTRLAEWLAPASEASSDKDAYRIGIELPGVDQADIHLTLDDGLITVKGEKKTSREEKGDTWYFSERQFGSFSRSFRLPPDADESGVRADMKDGVLTVTIPRKTPQKSEGRRVEINKM
ncbi:MAG: Hsp20/alpha crystallin family protein [Rhodobacteraceae bacterium]|jgi:HSP20 family protein|nr:Hsp20/alpha crystallin family protein [Paracoccaceae bacterium]